MDRDRFEEMKEPYALGALSEEERREFEAYLGEHPELQPEVEDLSALASLLALSPEEHDPPPELRRRILASVEGEATTPARAGSALDRLRTLFRPRNLALGAAAALVVVLLSFNVYLRDQIENLRSAQQPGEIALEGTGEMRDAEAQLVRVEGGRAVLVTENMPEPPEGKTFQLWVIDDGKPLPAGTFRPTSDAYATVVERPLQGAEAVAVTVEPEGGSPQPTSDPILSAQI